ncbi:uncharacterized protein K444DRAFT_620203 [Hyaloscypha bicolor E]|uniref:Uncharacterized protein n=1 Tax=Hyaloscypha bicolor E TaxID=1095630 RepID=A0A2J6SJW1_9HELO|nr:uncharacterized protein K444DRAFT_620203 [Hyaloscypha bicolor E]PMD51020.1 hypothetical protein K444DRAFT_620203 [Hyaloscypha bicolor E]
MPDPFRPEAAAVSKTTKSKDPFTSSTRTFKYTPINTPTSVPLAPPPAIPWNPRSLNSADDEALVRDNFPSPYDPKYYESGERQITGKDKAKMGGKFVVLIVVVVLTILGVGAGVGFTIKARA